MAIKDQVLTDKYAIYNGDCIEVMKDMGEKCIDLSIYSPPFGGLYNYSSSDRDLSNCKDYDEFFEHYKYVVQELTQKEQRAHYVISDIDDSGDPTYYGYLDKDGNYYILEENSANNTYRYSKGTSGYTTAWTNRATETYNYFDVEF